MGKKSAAEELLQNQRFFKFLCLGTFLLNRLGVRFTVSSSPEGVPTIPQCRRRGLRRLHNRSPQAGRDNWGAC